MYMTPSTTARTSTVRLLPPRFAGGIGGAMSAHSSSVRSLGYRSLLRSYRARFSRLHMAAVLPAPAVSGQSQPIQMTQLVPGQTLSLAALVAIPLGFLIGMSPLLSGALNPFIQVLRPVSPLAWMPLALFTIKDSAVSAIFVIFICSLWPMLLNTTFGVAS